jgi:chorismate mutase
MAVRALRGATALSDDDATEMTQAVVELLTTMLERNNLDQDALISLLFTATPDLHSQFPATAARAVGLADVPLLCAQELDVAGAMPRVVRILAHVESAQPRSAITHVYLRGTELLRTDLAR